MSCLVFKGAPWAQRWFPACRESVQNEVPHFVAVPLATSQLCFSQREWADQAPREPAASGANQWKPSVSNYGRYVLCSYLSKVKFLLNVGLLRLCLSFDWLLILVLQRNKNELLERTLVLNCAQTD